MAKAQKASDLRHYIRFSWLKKMKFKIAVTLKFALKYKYKLIISTIIVFLSLAQTKNLNLKKKGKKDKPSSTILSISSKCKFLTMQKKRFLQNFVAFNTKNLSIKNN